MIKTPISVSLLLSASLINMNLLHGKSFLYTYDPTGKVDPFMPIRIVPKNEKALNRLLRYPIQNFKLIGTLMGSTVSALLLTPEGEGISVYIGDKIGINRGRVVAITRDKVIVRELIENPANPFEMKQVKDTVLELNREESTDGGGPTNEKGGGDGVQVMEDEAKSEVGRRGLQPNLRYNQRDTFRRTPGNSNSSGGAFSNKTVPYVPYYNQGSPNINQLGR